MLMTCSTRLFNCLGCHCQVMVCQSCDQGQRYCGTKCRQIARKNSLKRANQKYQKSRQGRFNNAKRQRRFRQRQKPKEKKVTDHSSPSKPVCDLLVGRDYMIKKCEKTPKKHDAMVCHFCGQPCGPFFRLDFLKKRTTYPGKTKVNDNEGSKMYGDR